MKTGYVVVTGASKGIGRATALYLDQQGFNVFAGVRNAVDGQALQKEASSRLQPILIDVTNAEQIKRAAEDVAQAVGGQGVGGIVNKAGRPVGVRVEFIPLAQRRGE